MENAGHYCIGTSDKRVADVIVKAKHKAKTDEKTARRDAKKALDDYEAELKDAGNTEHAKTVHAIAKTIGDGRIPLAVALALAVLYAAYEDAKASTTASFSSPDCDAAFEAAKNGDCHVLSEKADLCAQDIAEHIDTIAGDTAAVAAWKAAKDALNEAAEACEDAACQDPPPPPGDGKR